MTERERVRESTGCQVSQHATLSRTLTTLTEDTVGQTLVLCMCAEGVGAFWSFLCVFIFSS